MSSIAVRLRPRGDHYVLCPEDGSWFRPLYTDGMCPLCGEPVAQEERGLPSLLRIDGFVIGFAAVASRATNAASRPSAMAPKPMVRGAVQPSLAAANLLPLFLQLHRFASQRGQLLFALFQMLT